MGDPPAVALPDSVVDEAQGLAVYLPRRIDSAGDDRLRLRLQITLYDAAADLPADAFERSGDSLPQGVEAGNASDDVGTDQLRVLALPASLGGVLGPVRAQPRAFTPQGDGVNDRVELTYTLFTVRSALVEVSVYTVDGIPVRRLYSGRQGAGPQLQVWDGRDDGGELLAPGIYLLKVDVQADRDRFSRLNPVALVY